MVGRGREGIAGVVATAVGAGEAVTRGVYLVAAVLLTIGGLTALTGARTPVVWFKICRWS